MKLYRMSIGAKISVFFVILFPNQVTKSSDTTTDMFSSKCVYQATTEVNLAEDHRQNKKELNIHLRTMCQTFVSEGTFGDT